MSKEPEKIKKRKSYQKPQVEQVKLVLDEAVLQACKGSPTDGSGKNAAGCSTSQCKHQAYGS